MTDAQKPDEIPQSVLDTAKAIFEWTEYEMLPANSVEYIARAIMAATAAEREACAQVADEWPEVETLLPLASTEHNEGARTGQYEAAERIAAAIRNRSLPTLSPSR